MRLLSPKRGLGDGSGHLSQVMGNGFQAELDFVSGHAFEPQPSEHPVLLYLSEDGFSCPFSIASSFMRMNVAFSLVLE